MRKSCLPSLPVIPGGLWVLPPLTGMGGPQRTRSLLTGLFGRIHWLHAWMVVMSSVAPVCSFGALRNRGARNWEGSRCLVHPSQLPFIPRSMLQGTWGYILYTHTGAPECIEICSAGDWEITLFLFQIGLFSFQAYFVMIWDSLNSTQYY